MSLTPSQTALNRIYKGELVGLYGDTTHIGYFTSKPKAYRSCKNKKEELFLVSADIKIKEIELDKD